MGDLHGELPKTYFDDFDAIIAPGDFCSDSIRKYLFKAAKEGYSKEWYEYCGRKKAKQLVLKSISSGKKVLKALNKIGKPVFVVPGNWDWTPDDDEWAILRKNNYLDMIKGLKNVHDVYHKLLSFAGYDFIGHGITSGPEYPQSPKYLSGLTAKQKKMILKHYKLLSSRMNTLFKKSKNPVILLSHNVPYNTSLDKIRNKKSPRNGEHFGSVVTREAILKYSPVLCVSGHMHENRGKCKLGKTIAINGGRGNKVNTLVKINGKKVKSVKFYTEK